MKIPYSHPSVLLYAERGVQTRCGYAYEFYGPFYCHLDHGIYIQEWFVEDFSEEVGDFALVLVLAHEWAHAVQGQLGGLHGLTIRIELQADCLAGSYARYVAYESENLRLSRGDIEVGATAFYLAGDSENTEWFDEYAHGTGKQRTDAYFVGLNYGYEECLSRDLVNGGLA
jgi:hypothetical protein